MKRRIGVLLALGAGIVLCCYHVRFEGEPRPVDPLLVAPLTDAPAWEAQPLLLRHRNESDAVYVVTGQTAPDGRFESQRLDVRSGARSSVRIPIGPGTPYLTFDSAEAGEGPAALEFRGLSLRRPTPHLFTYPEPGGPGFHAVESATGKVHVVTGAGTGRRSRLAVTLINSSRMPEIRSYLWSDKSKRLAAFLWRDSDHWTLYLFSLDPTLP
jgi:hypothetical protein